MALAVSMGSLKPCEAHFADWGTEVQTMRSLVQSHAVRTREKCDLKPAGWPQTSRLFT